ncbi:MAG: hypothetical protein WC955_01510, partial [Elusimicrobiota bacterium]
TYSVFPFNTQAIPTTQQRFVTPNNDGVNDSVIFVNVREVKVYDLNYTEVCTQQPDTSGIINWGCADNNDNAVPPGAYIYKAVSKNTGEVVVGVVVVVR